MALKFKLIYIIGPMSWVYRQMSQGMDPRALLRKIIPHETHIPDLDDLTLWKLVINIVCEPPPRTKLDHVNTLADVLHLMKTCKKIMVLTGAGVSVEEIYMVGKYIRGEHYQDF